MRPDLLAYPPQSISSQSVARVTRWELVDGLFSLRNTDTQFTYEPGVKRSGLDSVFYQTHIIRQ